MARYRRNVVLTGVAVVVGLSIVAVKWMPDWVSAITYAAQRGQSQAARQQLAQAADLSLGFQSVAKAIRPSVVSISSVIRISAERGQVPGPYGVPDEFRRFFGDDFDRFFEFPVPRGGFEQHGRGSGVIVSDDGYILTNNHVVRDADELTVTLSDKRQFKAKVVGTDAKTDLAVLKIEAQNLQPASLGDSDAVEVGQWVLAVGSPFGLDQTITAGIISAKGRADVGITDYEDFLQTDAAINPGNSGGPLVNLRGEVVGVNTAIASRNGGYQGIGFAIPSNMARQVMESILELGYVERGYMGALIQDLTEDLARSFGYNSTDGVLVGDVVPDGPAAKAGLQSGDIVLRYNGKPMKSSSQLRNEVARTKPGTRATLDVFRDGKEIKLQFSVGRFDDETASRVTPSAQPAASEELGIAVQPLTPDLAERLGYEGQQARSLRGVVVTQVDPQGLAARVGISPGTIIQSVNGTEVKTVSEFRQAVENADLTAGVRLQIMADGVRRFVFLKQSG